MATCLALRFLAPFIGRVSGNSTGLFAVFSVPARGDLEDRRFTSQDLVFRLLVMIF